jgi:hypothetical protein
MAYFTALDVSLRFVSICIVDEAGRVCYEAKDIAFIPECPPRASQRCTVP